MGIAGSIVREDFFQEYLGMRNEYVDMSNSQGGSMRRYMTEKNIKRL
jgi:L-fucose isomerase-like protein